MTGESDIGRKHLAHPPITDRHNEPVIIYLTVCSQDRKSIFAFEDSAAVIAERIAGALQSTPGRALQPLETEARS